MTRAERIAKGVVAACCPTCGRTLKQNIALAVDLNTNTVVANNRTVKVSAKHAELVFALQKAAPRTVSIEGIILTVWGINAEVSSKLVQVTVAHVRRALEQVGYTIKNYQLAGYALRPVPESKYTVATHHPKTTPEQRAMIVRDMRPHAKIARDYGVSPAFVSKIKRGNGVRTYKTCAL